MKMRIALVLALLMSMLHVEGAVAFTQSSVPPKFNIPWGNSAITPYIRTIPQNSQIGIQNCAASLTDGFPPLTFTPSASGGCPPFGADFNGIFKQITQWSQYQATGGVPGFDAAFSAAIGGYPNGAFIAAAQQGNYWLSLADNNTSNPDTGGANWLPLGIGVPSGSIFPFAGSSAPFGYFLCAGQAVSRTTYAALFVVIGTTYGIGDGVTTFNLPDLRGRVPFGVDNMGGTAANRLTSAGSGCNGTSQGTGCGSQNQTIAQTNLPNVNFNISGITLHDPGHTHSLNGSTGVQPFTSPSGQYQSGGNEGPQTNGAVAVTSTGSSTTGITVQTQGTAASGGNGTAVPSVPPAQLVNYIIKY